MARLGFKLTRRMLSQSRVIAKGKGIRGVKRLVAWYGGTASKWVKKSSPRLEVGVKNIEYHWYEHPGIGKFEVKLVEISRP